MYHADVESRNANIANCDFYYNMMHHVPFSTFMDPEHGNLPYKVLIVVTNYLNSSNVVVWEETY